MNKKDKFLSTLNKKLNSSQKQSMSLIQIVGVGKDSLVFQMPKGVVALTAIWEKIEAVGRDLNIHVSQTSGDYATLEDLDKIMGDITWLWKNWIPKGMVTMLAGDPGVGKSAIAQHITKIITCADCFPLEDDELPKPGNVIWVDTEASQQILKVRANTMKLDKKRVYIPAIDGDMLSQPDLVIDNNREYLTNMVRDLKPELMVLDSLGGSHTGGENKVEDIKPILEFLALMARDEEIACMVIHHLNKGHKDESPEVTLYRLRGSTVIPAMCRSILAIEPALDKKLRLRIVKTNVAKIPDPIAIIPLMNRDGDFTGFDYEPYVPPPQKKAKKEIVADWVLEQLQSNKEGMAVKDLTDLGEELGYTRQIIYTARDVLGSQVFTTGTGNKAYWHIYQNETDMRALHSVRKAISSNGKNSNHKENKNGKSAESTGSSGSGRKTAGRGGKTGGS